MGKEQNPEMPVRFYRTEAGRAPVLDWLKSKGDGHLTRINDILTRLMEAERRGGR